MAMFPKSLPPVINGIDVIDALPSSPARDASLVPLKEAIAEVPSVKDQRFVIVCSRDLSAEDEAIFKQHGKTLRWKKESFLNLPFEQLDFDFLFIDVRSKEARLTLGRQDLSLYHKVAYVYAIQKGVDDFLAEIDTVDISSIPQHAINGKDFRHQLLNQKMTAPSLIKSVFRFFVGCFTR
jgi:hypothetical protein